MKTKTRTAAILAATLAGALTVGARPQEQRQGGRQGRPDMAPQQQQHVCPACGQIAPQRRGQGQRGPWQPQQQRRYGQASPYQRFAPPPQQPPALQNFQNRQRFQQYQGRQGPQFQPTPRHQQQFQQRRQQFQPAPQFQPTPPQLQQFQQRRQQIIERFDRDGDGQLSEKERQAIKKELQKRQQGREGNKPDQQPKPKPKTPPAKE